MLLSQKQKHGDLNLYFFLTQNYIKSKATEIHGNYV